MANTNADNCIIHCRVSTPKQASERDSLEAQEIIGRGVASRNGWRVLRVFHEPYSGRKDHRPLINDILAFIKESPEPVPHYIFKGIDRLTRAGVIEYTKLKEQLEALGVAVVDSYGLIQPKQNTLEHLGVSYDWSVYSPSETAELLEAHRGKQEVRDILTRMIGAQIKLVRDGYKIARPSDGYVNQRVEVDGKKRVIEAPDPDRAHYFRTMFELRAEGRHSDEQIVKRLNAMGYRSKSTKQWNHDRTRVIGYTKPKPLTVQRLQEIVVKPIYCGVKVGVWTDHQPVRTKYPGLVSIETFNKANRGKIAILEHADGRVSLRRDVEERPQRLRANPDYPYKNVIMCPSCKTKPFLGSASRGKMGKHYPAYHCNRGHYLRIPKAEFEETVEQYLDSLELKAGFLDAFETALRKVWSKRQEEVAALAAQVEDQVEELKTEQDRVVSALIATEQPLVREKLEVRIKDIDAQIELIQDGPVATDLEPSDIDHFIASARELMEHPVEYLKNPAGIEGQRELWTLVFHDLPDYSQIANGTPNLSLIFALNRDFEDPRSLIVRLRRLRWNSITGLIARWTAVFRPQTNPGSSDSASAAA